MTICVAIKVHDCLVFAADSASSIQAADKPAILKVFNHGNKVFNLYKGLPICAMTCGMGNFGDVSVSTLAKDFRYLLKKKKSGFFISRNGYKIQTVANHAQRFFEEKYKALPARPKGDHSFEFWIGGYSSGSAHSEIWKIQIINGKCDAAVCVQKANDCGISWGGQADAVNRIVLGYGQGLPKGLAEAGVPPKDVPAVVQKISEHTRPTLVYPSMPVQDAITLVRFLVDTTKGFVGFLPGADTVGGDTDIAVVTKHEGFKWITRKHYYPAELNPLETDHA